LGESTFDAKDFLSAQTIFLTCGQRLTGASCLHQGALSLKP